MAYSLIRWWLCSFKVQWSDTQSDWNSRSWKRKHHCKIDHSQSGPYTQKFGASPLMCKVCWDPMISQYHQVDMGHKKWHWTRMLSLWELLLNQYDLKLQRETWTNVTRYKIKIWGVNKNENKRHNIPSPMIPKVSPRILAQPVAASRTCSGPVNFLPSRTMLASQ